MNKKECLKILFQCADQYRKNLENKNLLLFCTNNSKNKITAMETQFESKNFLHLTGVKFPYNKRLAPQTFYTLCLARRLSTNNFELAKDGTTEQKLSVLLQIVSSASLSANMIGNYKARRPALFTEKLVGNIRACVGFVYDNVRACYVPNTVLNLDMRDNISNRLRIIAVYKKNKCDKQYSELVYKANGINWSQINFPPQYKYIHKPQ